MTPIWIFPSIQPCRLLPSFLSIGQTAFRLKVFHLGPFGVIKILWFVVGMKELYGIKLFIPSFELHHVVLNSSCLLLTSQCFSFSSLYSVFNNKNSDQIWMSYYAKLTNIHYPCLYVQSIHNTLRGVVNWQYCILDKHSWLWKGRCKVHSASPSFTCIGYNSSYTWSHLFR